MFHNPQELMKVLGYQFKNLAFLTQALTRRSALNEQVSGAAQDDYQSLELVGDAALKHILSEKIVMNNPSITEGVLHLQLEGVLSNESSAMQEIAKKWKVDQYLIRGAGEQTITSKMRADTVEAILGAISIDSRACNRVHKGLITVIEKFWTPYLPSLKNKELVTTPQPTKKGKQKVGKGTTTTMLQTMGDKLPQAEQRVFSTLYSKATSDAKFKEYVQGLSNPNCRNVGNKKDTPLLRLAGKRGALPEDRHVARIQALIDHGALWSAKNYEDKTAAQLLKEKQPDIARRFKI